MYEPQNHATNATYHEAQRPWETAPPAAGSAKRDVESPKEAGEDSTLDRLATAVKVANTAVKIAGTAMSAMSLMRRLGLLGGKPSLFKLARRRNPLAVTALVGTGVLVGAGLGLLFAPVKGARVRRAIRGLIARVSSNGGSARARSPGHGVASAPHAPPRPRPAMG